MSSRSNPKYSEPATRKAKAFPVMGTPERLWLGVVLVTWAISTASLVAAVPPTAGPGKKLIEYGWDVPTPGQMKSELPAMEKRPFDGLIFRLAGGHNAFVTKPLEQNQFAEDERILSS